MLTEREQELIAIGASIASGCQPCTTYHFRAARLTGAPEDQIEQAVSLGLRVRRDAAAVMEQVGSRRNAVREVKPGGWAEAPARESLVTIGAAYAANCVPVLEENLAAATSQSTPVADILAALKIACAIKSMAHKKAHAAAARALGAGEDSDGSDSGEECGCGGGQPKREAPAQPCGCRE